MSRYFKTGFLSALNSEFLLCASIPITHSDNGSRGEADIALVVNERRIIGRGRIASGAVVSPIWLCAGETQRLLGSGTGFLLMNGAVSSEYFRLFWFLFAKGVANVGVLLLTLDAAASRRLRICWFDAFRFDRVVRKEMYCLFGAIEAR